LVFLPRTRIEDELEEALAASWIVSVPSMTVPQLKSMSSSWCTKSGVLVASLSDGAGLQP
jgi:hypothetical protein